jgi:hypothetical protein
MPGFIRRRLFGGRMSWRCWRPAPIPGKLARVGVSEGLLLSHPDRLGPLAEIANGSSRFPVPG